MKAICQWLDARPARLRWAGAFLAVALWLRLCQQLAVEWEINPQYSYGWGVPLLGLYLFWRRWKDRPPPGANREALGRLQWVILLGAALLPIRLVQEANPDWRLVSWAMAGTVVALSLLALGYAGGKGWTKHFWLPVAFVLLAVPWPTPVETLVVQSLMRAVAAITVEAANWYGVPAFREGNLIQLRNGIVGIDEACSGVRSFQATLMAAIFLGEMHRLDLRRRWFLAIAGVTLALALNVLRALWLTRLTVRGGPEAVASWHDPAGYLVLGLAFLGLWGMAVQLKRRAPPVPIALPSSLAARGLPAGWVIGLAAWLVLVEAGTQGWYWAHERGLEPRVTWHLVWPETEPGFRFEPNSEDTRRLLRYSTGQAAFWRRDDRGEWLFYWFRWAPGRAAAQLARVHSPEICLPASGLRLTSWLGVHTIRVRGLSLPFRVYRFDWNGKPLLVFFCLWEDRRGAPDLSAQEDLLSRRNRFRAVLGGQRHLGQVMFEVAMTGGPELPQAELELTRFLEGAARVEAAGK